MKLHPKNKSGLKGVCWNKKNSMWMASISFCRKWEYLGLFKDKFKAHEAYIKALIRLHREMVLKYKNELARRKLERMRAIQRRVVS